MAEQKIERRLAAVLAADVVGYSRMMAVDEEGTLARLNAHRREFWEPTISAHRGRIVKRTGDGMLVEFGSAVDATRCAVETQQGMAKRNEDAPAAERIDMRIGVHIGDIIFEEGDIFGDGVNIAARLESIAQPGGISISEDAWRQVNGKVTADFVDTGAQSLKNIPRPVRVYRLKLEEVHAVEAPLAAPSPRPETPSIAVLPFQNMSGDPEQEHFCDGLVEDIITTLSKLSGLRVIARNSSFVYKGRSVDVREAAKQLGVRYVLEGSVRKSGNRIRITAQLIDAKDGSHVWAERYDRSIEDIFAIQDEITLILATEMQVKLTDGEQTRLRYTTTHNVEAWTHWVQGLSYYRQAINKENTAAAVLCWEKALALDPASAALNAMLGFMHSVEARFGWGERGAMIAKSRAYVDRALEIDPGNADAHILLGILAAWNERYDEAASHVSRAVQLAPGAADILNLAAFILAPSGYPEEALPLAIKSVALNPNHPPVYFGILGNAYRLCGQFDEAIRAFEAYNARQAGFGLVDLVMAHHEKGQPDHASDAAKRLLSARPDFTIAAWRKSQWGSDQARLQADVAALRAAGLPEG
jgi:adenylate cyclase